MEWLGIIICLFVASAIHGWFSGNARLLAAQRQKLDSEIEQRMRECEREISKRKTELGNHVATAERALKTRTDYINDLRDSLAKGFLSGRKWLATYIAEADRALDDQIASRLKHKSHPARKASEEVAAARAERRAYKERVKFLEYQLKSYEECFPILADYREVILDEAVSLSATTDNTQALEDADPVLSILPERRIPLDMANHHARKVGTWGLDCVSPFQGCNVIWNRVPRAAPWAIVFRSFGAFSR